MGANILDMDINLYISFSFDSGIRDKSAAGSPERQLLADRAALQ